MATADEIERIIVEIESQGADKAYVGIKRIDEMMDNLSKKKPADFLEGFNALESTLSKSLVQLPNMTSLTDQATEAWQKLVKEVRRYDESMAKKHNRNLLFEEARQDAKNLTDQIRKSNRVPLHLAAAPAQLTKGQKAFQAFSRTFGPKATQGLVSTVETIETIGPAMAKIGPPTAIAAAAVGAFAIGAAGVAITAAKSFGGAVVQAQGFRQNMSFALEKIAGTSAQADAIIGKSVATADYLGQKHTDTVRQITALVGKGFSASTADKFARGLADMEVRSPGTNFDSMIMAIGQIKAKGKLQGEELMQLAEAGLNRGDFMGNLAKQAGKNVDEIDKAMQAGKVSYQQFEKAFFATINKNGGPLGALANEASRKNIDKVINRLKAIPENILFGANAGSGMSAMTEQLNNFIDWFDVSKGKGKEVQKVTGDIFNAMIEGLTGNKVDTKKGITGTLDAILAGAKEAVPAVREFASGIRDIAGVLAELGKNGDAKQMMIWARAFMQVGMLGLSAMSMFDSIGSTDIGGTLSASFESITASISATASSIMTQAYQIGANLWQGLTNGITSGIAMVTSAATNLANSALQAVGVTWRVGSPARAFEDLAGWAGPGMERGFRSGEPGAMVAAANLADAALGAAWASSPANANAGGTMAPAGGAAGAAGLTIHFSPTIVISGAKTADQAQALGAAAVRGSREAFETQLGAALRRARAA